MHIAKSVKKTLKKKLRESIIDDLYTCMLNIEHGFISYRKLALKVKLNFWNSIYIYSSAL